MFAAQGVERPNYYCDTIADFLPKPNEPITDSANNHDHAVIGGKKVPAKSTTGTSEDTKGMFSFCYPSDAVVELADASTKAMHQLEIGDVVRTASGFEPVSAFLHAQREKNNAHTPSQHAFLSFSFTNSTDVFVVSAEHHVFLSSGQTVKAGDVTVGQILIGSDHTERVISSIERVTKPDGYFAPLTRSGTIVVNGIFASTYAGGPSGDIFQTVASLVCTPLRFFGASAKSLPTPSSTSSTAFVPVVSS